MEHERNYVGGTEDSLLCNMSECVHKSVLQLLTTQGMQTTQVGYKLIINLRMLSMLPSASC